MLLDEMFQNQDLFVMDSKRNYVETLDYIRFMMFWSCRDLMRCKLLC